MWAMWRDLAASIADIGLLHPIVVRPGGLLIAGERRLRACESLGWTTIAVHIVDLADVVRGELDENTQREPFLPSEIEAIRRTLEPIEKAAAQERQSAGTNLPENFGKGRHETRDQRQDRRFCRNQRPPGGKDRRGLRRRRGRARQVRPPGCRHGSQRTRQRAVQAAQGGDRGRESPRRAAAAAERALSRHHRRSAVAV